MEGEVITCVSPSPPPGVWWVGMADDLTSVGSGVDSQGGFVFEIDEMGRSPRAAPRGTHHVPCTRARPRPHARTLWHAVWGGPAVGQPL